MAVLVTLLAVVIALLAVLVAGLLRTHAEILRALRELGAGLHPDAADAPASPRRAARSTGVRAKSVPAREAADITGHTPTGEAISVGVVGAKHPTLLVFLTTGCTTCAELWSAFAALDPRDLPGGVRVVAVVKGPEAESTVRAQKVAPPDVPVVMSSAAWDAYDVPVAPYFAYVDGRSGTVVREGAAVSWAQLCSMMQRALEDAGVDATPSGR